jgi:tetratricopeptide (TPR) repeat protein
MATSTHGQQFGQQRNPRYAWPSRGFIVIIVIVTIILLTLLGTLSILGIISNKLALIIAFVIPLATFSVTLIRAFFPQKDEPGPVIPLSQISITTILPSLSVNIYPNNSFIEKIYVELIQSNTTAIVLTGSPGAGKSTVAAQLYNYAEEQRQEGREPFTARALWFRVDANLTVAELIGNILSSLGKSIPHFDTLPPQNQVQALINALDIPDESRLICIDQFESFFEWGGNTGFTGRPGMNEWLDALSQQIFINSHSRIVFTCNSILWKIEEHHTSYLKEQHVGWSATESVEFLKHQGIQVGTGETELERMVSHYRGNALALTFLASILPRDASLSLEDFAYNTKYAHILMSNSTNQLLDYIWQRLPGEQRNLLLGFSVYREPVPLEAAQAAAPTTTASASSATEPSPSKAAQMTADTNTQVAGATLENMLQQHLLVPAGAGLYQLHSAVANFVRDHFNRRSEQANYQARQEAHAKAAQFYLREATNEHPSEKQQWGRGELYLLVEATWQSCRAGQFREAYELMEQRDIFFRLSRWGGNAILLELYQLLLPPDKWKATRIEAAYIRNNLGEAYYALENREKAHKNFELALPLFQEEHNRSGEARALHNLGLIYYQQGQEMQFWQHLEYSWEFLIPDEQMPVTAKRMRRYRQQSLEAQRYLHRALHYLEQALFIRREIGEREGTGKTLHNLGRVYSALHQKELALDYYEEALDTTREVGDRMEEEQVLHNLGRLCNTLGKKEKLRALEYLEQALRIQQEVGDRKEEGMTWNSQGRVYDDIGKKQEAWLSYQQALRIAREVGDRWGEAITLHNISALYYDLGLYEDMLAFLLLAKVIFEEMQSPYRDRAERHVDLLRAKIGNHQFETLLAQVQPEVIPRVEQRLQEGLPLEEQSQKRAYFSFSLPGSPKATQTEVVILQQEDDY